MARKDQRVDAYIERSASFAKPILKHLRKIVHRGCPTVVETIKWQFPHFEHNGILCAMGAFKEHCAFWFWNRELLFGRDREKGMSQFGRIKSITDLPNDKMLVGYVRRAAQLNESGRSKTAKRQRKPRPPVRPPAYFLAVLKKNAKAKKTFDNFSPSHQREYIEWIVNAKRDETRQKRLKTAIEWLSEGKPQNWRYMKKS